MVRGFSLALERGLLAHAYLVVGPDLESARELTKDLLLRIYCEAGENRPCGACRACRWVCSRQHPDIVWVEPESRARQITIERVRDQVMALLHQTSFIEGGWKTAVLLEADCLNPSAANALLKTLEEPPPRSLLLLVTTDPQRLPSTIRSRCQWLRVERPGLRLGAWGRRALEILAQPSSHRGWLVGLVKARALQGLVEEAEDEARKREVAAQGEGEPAERDIREARIHAAGIAAMNEILQVLQLWYRDVWASALGLPRERLLFAEQADVLQSSAAGLRPADALDAIRAIEVARRRLERNLPKDSVWEALFRQLPIC